MSWSASIVVPADSDDDSAGTISIAINILRAADTDRSLGALLVNPGGPGVPGTELAEAFAFGAFPAELTDNFDIVGFDPRGVGDSSAVELCTASMGQVVGRLHTDFVARDMDQIRAALGQDQISYLGFSYGSVLGAWYATLRIESIEAAIFGDDEDAGAALFAVLEDEIDAERG